VLDWPFDVTTPIAAVNYVDLDQVCVDASCVWNDNGHFLAYDCAEEYWPDTGQERYMQFYRDRATADVVVHADGHNGLDLNLPTGTPLVSQWDTTIYTEGDLNIIFLLDDAKLALKLGHIDYRPNHYMPDAFYEVKRGDVVGWVKAGNGYTFRHRKTSIEYTEIHFEIMLLKDGRHASVGHYTTTDYSIVDGLVGECNQDPPVRWRTGLDGLTWVGGVAPDADRLVSTHGGNP